jgi:iron complex transport system substrate-binding protein
VRALIGVLSAVLAAWPAQAQPKRIVSTFPSATETLFALGLGARVVGVSTYCRYPPEVLDLPKIGTYSRPDPEKIALLRPDLVLISPTSSGLADRLSAVGLRYVQVENGSLADVFSMIQNIGRAAGLAAKAESLNLDIRSRLDAMRAANAGLQKPTVLMVVGRTPGLLTNLIAVGPSTYLGELLEIAGGSNALKDTAIPYPRISLETVVRLDPAVILDMSEMGESAEPRVREERLQLPWLAHRELAAVRNGKVYGLASEALVTPGPRVIDAVEEIRARIRTASHPSVER